MALIDGEGLAIEPDGLAHAVDEAKRPIAIGTAMNALRAERLPRTGALA